jgi:H+/Cl- antiporter ClcA
MIIRLILFLMLTSGLFGVFYYALFRENYFTGKRVREISKTSGVIMLAVVSAVVSLVVLVTLETHFF